MQTVKINIEAGGIFSKFMFGIQNAQKLSLYDKKIYFNIIDKRIKGVNPFDFIFDQKNENDCISYTAIHLGNYTKKNPIEDSNNFENYKKIVNNINFKKSFLDRLQNEKAKINFEEEMLGIHIRLTDMNIAHANDYGILSFENYKLEIEKNIKENTKIFVASDNEESLNKIKQIYGDRVYCLENITRAKTENENTYNLQIENFTNEHFWIEVFLEMMLLSCCESIICRTSNLINASILYSNTIKKIIRI